MKYTKFLILFAVIAALLPAIGTRGEESNQPVINLAEIIYGSIQDADYSTLGYMTLQTVAKRPDVGRTAFSEKVGAPDAVRVMEEYIADGYNVIWAHSSIYTNSVYAICDKYPEVSFILEGDGKPKEQKSNVWLIDRNYYSGFYVIGKLAALKSSSKKVAFVGAVKLPFQMGIINAIEQAVKETDPSVDFKYLFVGSFDDPMKSRQTAETLITQGYDILMSGLNLGNYGLFEAAKGKPVYITTMYTDKQNINPKNYLSSEIFDFTIPVNYILDQIDKGIKGGYTFLAYGLAEDGKPRYTQLPAFNVSDKINQALKATAKDISTGKIKVVENLKTLPEK